MNLINLPDELYPCILRKIQLSYILNLSTGNKNLHTKLSALTFWQSMINFPLPVHASLVNIHQIYKRIFSSSTCITLLNQATTVYTYPGNPLDSLNNIRQLFNYGLIYLITNDGEVYEYQKLVINNKLQYRETYHFPLAQVRDIVKLTFTLVFLTEYGDVYISPFDHKLIKLAQLKDIEQISGWGNWLIYYTQECLLYGIYLKDENNLPRLISNHKDNPVKQIACCGQAIYNLTGDKLFRNGILYDTGIKEIQSSQGCLYYINSNNNLCNDARRNIDTQIHFDKLISNGHGIIGIAQDRKIYHINFWQTNLMACPDHPHYQALAWGLVIYL